MQNYFTDTNVLIFSLAEFYKDKHLYSRKLIDNTDKKNARYLGFISYTIFNQFENKTNEKSINITAEKASAVLRTLSKRQKNNPAFKNRLLGLLDDLSDKNECPKIYLTEITDKISNGAKFDEGQIKKLIYGISYKFKKTKKEIKDKFIVFNKEDIKNNFKLHTNIQTALNAFFSDKDDILHIAICSVFCLEKNIQNSTFISDDDFQIPTKKQTEQEFITTSNNASFELEKSFKVLLKFSKLKKFVIDNNL
jgi:hypothetical protein